MIEWEASKPLTLEIRVSSSVPTVKNVEFRKRQKKTLPEADPQTGV